MKLPEQYAHALLHAAKNKDAEGFDSFFDSFVGYLKDHHHEKLLPRIQNAVKRFTASSQAANAATLTVRAKGEEDKFAKLIDQYADVFGNSPQIQVDEHIVGGAILRNRTHLIDTSYRKGLMNLYESLKK